MSLESDMKSAHKNQNRSQTLESESCGCFYCLEIFPPSEIDTWSDEDEMGIAQVAWCPKCGIDAVIASKSGFPINKEFLCKMNAYWF